MHHYLKTTCKLIPYFQTLHINKAFYSIFVQNNRGTTYQLISYSINTMPFIDGYIFQNNQNAHIQPKYSALHAKSTLYIRYVRLIELIFQKSLKAGAYRFISRLYRFSEIAFQHVFSEYMHMKSPYFQPFDF